LILLLIIFCFLCIYLNFSIEDDFVSWKEKLWDSVCSHFNIEETGEESNIRQYKLVDCSEILPERVFTGEISRLKSYENQRL